MNIKRTSICEDHFSVEENFILWENLKGSCLPYLNFVEFAYSTDLKIASVMRELEEYQLVNPRMRNIPPMMGQILNLLIKCSNSKRIFEIGTANGYSTLWLASAAKQIGGHIVSYEKFDWKAKLADEAISRAGLSEFVTIKNLDVLDETIDENFSGVDFLFLDIWSGDYISCINKFKYQLKNGAMIAADNMVSHRNRDGIAIPNEGESAEYISLVRNSPHFQSAFIPIGSGLEITYLIKEFANVK